MVALNERKGGSPGQGVCGRLPQSKHAHAIAERTRVRAAVDEGGGGEMHALDCRRPHQEG